MTPLEMLTSVRYWIDEPNPGHWTQVELMSHLFNGQQRVCRAISNIDPTFFIASTLISFTADGATYALPRNFRLGGRVAYVEFLDTDGTVLDFAYDIRLRDQVPLNVGAPSLPNDLTFGFVLEGNVLRIAPTPSSARTNALRVWYTPVFGDMQQGDVSAATATTLTLPQQPTYRMADTSILDDFYNGMTVRIIAGTGIGEEKAITDYTGGSTRQATVSTWTATPTSSSDYAILCPVPEDFHDVVVLEAAKDASAKRPSKTPVITAALADRRMEMLSWVSERQTFRMETIEPVDTGY